MGVYNVWDYEMNLEIKTVSDWHDGSFCLLKDGKVRKHIIGERVVHDKHLNNNNIAGRRVYHSKKIINYFDENIDDVICSHIRLSHHTLHASHSFYDSGFGKALCIIIDGSGCYIPVGIKGTGPISDVVQYTRYGDSSLSDTTFATESRSAYLMEYPNKLNLVYREAVVPFDCNVILEDNKTWVTNTVSPAKMFEVICEWMGMKWYDAGKLMAMASYGKDGCTFDPNEFVMNDFNNISFPNRELNSFQEKCDYALALQKYSQNYVKDFILESIKRSGCKNVVLSGGYFLNCVSNTYLHQNLPKDVNIFVEPICGDDGISIGLAKYEWYRKTKSKKRFPLQNIYYGKRQEINVDGKKVSSKDVAQLLVNRKVIGIFQSRSESGPRALGNRSILYDPRDPNGRDKINKLKGREDYRPLAATVLHEHAHKWFDMCNLKESPYMLYTLDVLSDEVPAIMHVDRTCRVQTLKKSFNKHYYNLIKEFNHITGVPLVLNTSLNLAGDTIAETVEDALHTLNNSEIDYLYFPETNTLVAASQSGT